MEYVSRLRSLVAECGPRLRSIEPGAARARPRPDAWSPSEIVGHLVDSASNNHQRFVRARFQRELVFPGYDQEAWVDAQRYREGPWSDLVDLWAAFNLHLARVMESTPPGVRSEPRREHNLDVIAWTTVPRDRAASLDYFMEDYVGHLEHHLVQILGDDVRPESADR